MGIEFGFKRKKNFLYKFWFVVLLLGILMLKGTFKKYLFSVYLVILKNECLDLEKIGWLLLLGFVFFCDYGKC